ncbi:MAG: hypothetical protein ACRDDY_18725, partial [Clostridium sp.]|uniref:hypothetical protein n=1 Tax=Clostridium sp. TaxID=1506 RepID=UPI003EE6AD35
MKACGHGIQIQKKGGGVVKRKENVLFNSLTTTTFKGIYYNSYTGVFTIRDKGEYYISWWISMKYGLGCFGTSFSLVFSDGQIITAVSEEQKGQIIGDAYIEINEVPITFRLVNTSCSDVIYSCINGITANLIVSTGIQGPM